MKIIIYGSEHCSKCNPVFDTVKELIEEFNLDAEVEKETDPATAAQRGIMNLPALAVDGEVKIAGRVASKEEIKKTLNI